MRHFRNNSSKFASLHQFEIQVRCKIPMLQADSEIKWIFYVILRYVQAYRYARGVFLMRWLSIDDAQKLTQE